MIHPVGVLQCPCQGRFIRPGSTEQSIANVAGILSGSNGDGGSDYHRLLGGAIGQSPACMLRTVS